MEFSSQAHQWVSYFIALYFIAENDHEFMF